MDNRKGFNRLALLLTLVLMATILLIGCTNEDKAPADDSSIEENGEETQNQKTLIMGDNNPPGDVNPLIGLNITSQCIDASVYETLVGRASKESSEGELIEEPNVFTPKLAESWEISDDGLEYIFKLREDVTFHSGSKFDAEDVKFSFDLLRSEGSYASYYGGLISEVEVLDPYKVKIILNRVEPQFLKRISTYNGSIISKDTLMEEAGNDVQEQMQWLASNEAGTGPYVLKSITTDEAHLDINTEYWGEKPDIDKIIVKTVAESSNLKIMLEKGDINFYRLPAAKDYASLEENPDVKLLVRPSNSKIVYLGLNTEKKPFDNPKVRKAIAHAIPYDQICKVLGGGEEYSPKARSILTSELSGFVPIFNYEYNLDKAKELLKEAGYEDGFKMKFDLFNSGSFPKTAVILQSEFEKIGIEMEINAMAPPTFFQTGDAGDLNTFVVSWWDNAADPVGILNDIAHSSSIPSPGNYAKYSNEELDRLIDEGMVEMDLGKREEILKRAQDILCEDLPYIPLNEAKIVIAMRENVKNYIHYSDSIPRFYEMKIE